jgi:hypothetical protein
MSKASPEVQRLAREMQAGRIPARERRAMPRIAWNRLIDVVRSR